MTAAALVLALGLAAQETPTPPSVPAAPAAPSPWTSLLGSGLLTLQDTNTLQPGKFTLAFTVDNRDRDPLGLDLVDGAAAWNMGVTRWAEFFGHHVFSRSVAVPDTPVLPPPPLDAILAPGTTAPRRPYYSLYSPSHTWTTADRSASAPTSRARSCWAPRREAGRRRDAGRAWHSARPFTSR